MKANTDKLTICFYKVVAIATKGGHILHLTTNLAAAVGRGEVVWARRRLRGEGGIPLVLGQVWEAMACACLDLLVTGSGRSLGRE